MAGLYTENSDNIWFGVACDEKEIFSTAFALTRQRTFQNLLKRIPCNVNFQYPAKKSPFAGQVFGLLKDVYDGNGGFRHFSLVKSYLSSYAEKVLDVVSLIPVGWVASYISVARVAGGSPRAVGRVMSLNSFPLLVPCHRVVRSDFRPGGYSGGVDVKLEILTRECRGSTHQRKILVDRGCLLVYPTERVLESSKGM